MLFAQAPGRWPGAGLEEPLGKKLAWGLLAYLLGSRFLVPGNFRMIWVLLIRGPGLGSWGSWSPEWAVKRQGEPHLQGPTLCLALGRDPIHVVCLILINELQFRDSLVHSSEKYLLSTYYVSNTVLGTGC